MILRIRGIEIDFNFLENNFWTLEVQNPLFLREIFESFSSGEEEDENKIHQLIIDSRWANDRLIFISNPFENSEIMAMFSKKLKKYLANNFRSIEDETTFIKLATSFDDFIQDIIRQVELSLDYDNFNFEKFIKLANFRIHENTKIGGTKQTLYDIIDLTSELQPYSVICFLNLKHFLTDEEFQNLLEYALSKETKLMFLESSSGNFYNEQERVVVVDDDLFVIEKSF